MWPSTFIYIQRISALGTDASEVQGDRSAGEVFERDFVESGATHLAGQVRGVRELLEGGREIPVGVAGARDEPANQGEDPPRIEVIDGREQPVARLGEL